MNDSQIVKFGDPEEVERIVKAIKAGRPFRTDDMDAMRSAPWVAIQELRRELAEMKKK